ncbi:unnamed protein product [Tilletia controversa]|uniref:Uncharacterized protein n=2 Tax=Tilletia TaxID=13289 RepID=A0A177UDQ3_9BASI|nr:hypothetical protein CF336_g3369 [Tilletia laevis]KAE8262058.1 hypothetical protein A4X03_0g2755 [Tilletia caries]CAD6898025.1 unnamed protein product [Tilletia controversa]KAE8204240.1 hypothetical protein CF335_g2728 [Tilletia laevis]CAD6885853.1 unnamed protein product [Tilletia caries]
MASVSSPEEVSSISTAITDSEGTATGASPSPALVLDDDEFDDIHIDDGASAPVPPPQAELLLLQQPALEDISPKSHSIPLPDSYSDPLGTPVVKRSSLLARAGGDSNAAAAGEDLAAAEHTPRIGADTSVSEAGAGLPGDATPTPATAAEIGPEPSRLSVDADSGSRPTSTSGPSSPSATRRPLFWGLLRSGSSTAPPTPQGAPVTADRSASSVAPVTSETSSPSAFPRLSLGSNPMAVSSANTGPDSASSSNSGGRNSRNSLAPSFFMQPTSPSSPGPAAGGLSANIHMTPEPPSRKASAFSPFATIMSNLRTRSSNATSTTSSAQNDDLDGRSRLPRREIDEDQLAEDIMRFADARHVLRTENSPEELRQLGLRLEEAWREKLAELNALRAKLEAAQDTVSDLEDENVNLRTQLGLLSEQVAARESDLEDFQRLTIGQVEAQRSLWEEEGREERENLEFSLAQAKRSTLEQKSINAQLRLVILGTLQGRLDGLTDWLAKQNEGDSRRTSKRLSVQIGRRRESLKSMMLKMHPVGEDGEVEAEEVIGTNASTPLMRQQNFDGSEADVSHSAALAASAMDEVSSTTSGKAPGGSWSPKRSIDGDDGEGKDEDDEECDNLFDIEDVLFNLPTSPSAVPGRRSTMLFNEPLNLEQLRQMGFFRESIQNGFNQDGSDDTSLGGGDGLPLSPSESLEKGSSGLARLTSAAGYLSPSKFAMSPSSTSGAVTGGGGSLGAGGLTEQRLLLMIEKLQADTELAEAARVENVMLQKRLHDEQRRAGELEEALVQTKIRLEQTEAAVSDLFGGEGEEAELDDGRSEEGGGGRGGRGFANGNKADVAAEPQAGLGLVTDVGALEQGRHKSVPVA